MIYIRNKRLLLIIFKKNTEKDISRRILLNVFKILIAKKCRKIFYVTYTYHHFKAIYFNYSDVTYFTLVPLFHKSFNCTICVTYAVLTVHCNTKILRLIESGELGQHFSGTTFGQLLRASVLLTAAVHSPNVKRKCIVYLVFGNIL